MLLLQENTNSDWTIFGFDLYKLIEKLQGWGESFILKLPNFLVAVLVFVLFWYGAKYVSKFVRNILMRGVKQDSIKVMAGQTAFAITVLIGFFIALGIMDLDKVLTSVLAGAGVVGLAIGLALQGTLNNTFSGVILSFMPKLQLGDWVESNDYSGIVEDITLRNVTIRQADNNYVIIPNANIVDSPFKNWSQTQRSRVFLSCGVGYESDLEAVKKLTIETLTNEFEQQSNEDIEFFYEGFGDSSINFVARFWAPVTKRKDMLVAQDRAIIAIKKAFDAHDINIPFPIRTLDFGKNKFRSETITIANSDNSKR
ncbi:mechanosensitive ion channel family protein [Leeuwenhoekiella blandensis]|uniref:Putative mechanosensitive channel protein (MscS family protein) n=1 Tax=Leeuwenhoekiella blandensis (strain CECT 7118 / CCUG 51940 / KCTC 22103 / MED217) TaxID=398720 RepID=A3XLN3_LEEBM|nr:mechanosensitive ion channel [Leeuwenhoekiella blandensis]EAQ49534.1 putative mechanosensitive channel protein (MscS family protein) [Leeuwenhoekiella blandensis MED217]